MKENPFKAFTEKFPEFFNSFMEGKIKEQMWIDITEHALKTGAYVAPSIPYILNLDMNTRDVQFAEKQVYFIYSNWNYIEQIIYHYNHLIDFSEKYLGNEQINNLINILKKYHDFVTGYVFAEDKTKLFNGKHFDAMFCLKAYFDEQIKEFIKLYWDIKNKKTKRKLDWS